MLPSEAREQVLMENILPVIKVCFCIYVLTLCLSMSWNPKGFMFFLVKVPQFICFSVKVIP